MSSQDDCSACLHPSIGGIQLTGISHADILFEASTQSVVFD